MMTLEDYMHLPKKRLAEMLVERDKEQQEKLVTVPFNPPYPMMPPIIVQGEQHPYCYEPGGTCTNPHMDCINCPRHGHTGGYWSTGTSINKQTTQTTLSDLEILNTKLKNNTGEEPQCEVKA